MVREPWERRRRIRDNTYLRNKTATDEYTYLLTGECNHRVHFASVRPNDLYSSGETLENSQVPNVSGRQGPYLVFNIGGRGGAFQIFPKIYILKPRFFQLYVIILKKYHQEKLRKNDFKLSDALYVYFVEKPPKEKLDMAENIWLSRVKETTNTAGLVSPDINDFSYVFGV